MEITLANEALARLEAFKATCTGEANYETIESLIDTFVAALNAEVR